MFKNTHELCKGSLINNLFAVGSNKNQVILLNITEKGLEIEEIYQDEHCD
jgi:hypothetical protein